MRGISKGTLLLLVLLLLISPVFGIVLADIVGYHEPLDIAAEMLGLKDVSEEVNWTPFYDYSFPGLPDELGYIVSGAIGLAAIFALGFLLKLLAGRGSR